MKEKCNLCKRNILEVDGCENKVILSRKTVRSSTKEYLPIKVGTAGDFVDATEERCPECNAEKYRIHHSECPLEACPVCKQQRIFCDCILLDKEV